MAEEEDERISLSTNFVISPGGWPSATFEASAAATDPLLGVASYPAADHVMVAFAIPDDPLWLQAVGRMGLRHAQLEHVQRMTVKVIEEIPLADVESRLGVTAAAKIRERIRREFNERVSDPAARGQLDFLIDRCCGVSQRRNAFLHAVIANAPDGTPMLRTGPGNWTALPEITEIVTLENDILSIAKELNHERRHGFIRAALDAAKSSAPPTGP